MMNRFVGKLAELAAIFRAHSQKPQVPKMTASELENIEFRALTSWPKYYQRKGKYYKMINEKQLQLVVSLPGFRAVVDRSSEHKHFLFLYWRNDSLEAKGYKEISETLYHHFYTKVSNRNNLLHLQNIVKPLYDI